MGTGRDSEVPLADSEAVVTITDDRTRILANRAGCVAAGRCQRSSERKSIDIIKAVESLRCCQCAGPGVARGRILGLLDAWEWI